MQREATGVYASSIAGGEVVRAFVPNALPPTPTLEMSNPRQRLLERATLALGRLDSVCTLLPDPQLFLYAYVRREAVLSSQIEGTQSSLSDLLLFELDEAPGVPFDDVVEVSNYIAALEHGLARLAEGFPLCNRLLREMHMLLMARGRGSDKAPGEFRRSQNWIGGTRPGNARFVPPPPQELESCMAALEGYINHQNADFQNVELQNEDAPVLIKAALAHVQFETIHPFLDGNGRLGRLLIVMMLYTGGLLSQPLLYLSLYFKLHRDVYYELLNRVRTQGDWEAWVDFFLEGVMLTATGAVTTAQNLVALFEADSLQAKNTGRGASSALRVLGVLRHHPICNLKQLKLEAQMSFPTADKALQTLIKLGIVRELTQQRRNRIFVYEAYLAILNEEGEQL